MKLSQFLKFIDFLSFVVNQHLKKKSLALLGYKVMHGFIDLNPIFDGIFGSFNETSLWLIGSLILSGFSKLIQLANSYALLLYTFLPYF